MSAPHTDITPSQCRHWHVMSRFSRAGHYPTLQVMLGGWVSYLVLVETNGVLGTSPCLHISIHQRVHCSMRIKANCQSRTLERRAFRECNVMQVCGAPAAADWVSCLNTPYHIATPYPGIPPINISSKSVQARESKLQLVHGTHGSLTS